MLLMVSSLHYSDNGYYITLLLLGFAVINTNDALSCV